MRIDIITVLPEMLEGFVHESILARAEKKGLAEIRLHNLRDYTKDKWRRGGQSSRNPVRRRCYAGSGRCQYGAGL